MKVLILSCSTGEGHNSCAKALQEVYIQNGIPCEIYDAMNFLSSGFSEMLAKGHTLMYRKIPGLMRVGYKSAERHPNVFREDSALFKFFANGAEQLYALVQDKGYDVIISTHLFAAVIVSALQLQYSVHLRTGFLATDYTCFPAIADCNVDWFFIPPGLTDEFVRCGIPKEKIRECGIPIRRSFFTATEKEAAKRACGIAPQHKHLIVMCGSMGCGPIAKITEMAAWELPAGCEVTVVCGTNQHLYEKLSRYYVDNKSFHIREFVQDMSQLMDSGDLLLMKPGGISVTEAAKKQIPMVLVDAVAGCEAYNLQYFVALGAAVTAADPAGLAEASIALLTNPQALQRMAECYGSAFQEDAAAQIYQATAGVTENA